MGRRCDCRLEHWRHYFSRFTGEFLPLAKRCFEKLWPPDWRRFDRSIYWPWLCNPCFDPCGCRYIHDIFNVAAHGLAVMSSRLVVTCEGAAALAGINTRWMTVKIFALMGMLTGISQRRLRLHVSIPQQMLWERSMSSM